jgi:hypothetical protein
MILLLHDHHFVWFSRIFEGTYHGFTLVKRKRQKSRQELAAGWCRFAY